MATFKLPDPYAGKTAAEMKTRCRELISVLEHWQFTAMTLAEKHGTDGLSAERAEEVTRYINAYKD